MKKDLRKLCTNYEKRAFTLAEVLITLGIIGVVAAVTLPTLIQNHQKQTYVTGMKKGISIYQNMVKKMQADEVASSLADIKLFTEGGCAYDDNSCEVSGDGAGNPSVYEELIPKYLNVVKICKGNECNNYHYASVSCYKGACSLTKSDATYGVNNIFGYAFAASGYLESDLVRGFYTNDGMIFYFAPFSDRYFAVGIDVNGDKGPNTVGRDFICITLYKSDGFEKLGDYFNVHSHLMSNGWVMDY